MVKTEIYDLSKCALSRRNGMYLGQAGSKEGIIINGENWIVKYPKTTRSMRGDLDSYTTAPLSEYIGSHIYDILGYDVHETILGVRNNKLVVACKDFCDSGIQLREIRALKNIYNAELEQQLDESFSSTGSAHSVDLNELLIHLKYNPVLKDFPALTERLWDCSIIDGLINNNDRNNGNWGLLYRESTDEYTLAPIYDNGASFSNKMSEDRVRKMVADLSKTTKSALNTISSYSLNGKQLQFRDLMRFENPNLKESLRYVVPLIRQKMSEIKEFIDGIPEMCDGLLVCSNERKDFYIAGMETRMEQILEPAYELACNAMDEYSWTSKRDTQREKDAESGYFQDTEDLAWNDDDLEL